MNTTKTTRITKNSFSFASLSIAIVALFMGILISVFPSHRQYYPMGVSTSQDNDGDIGDAKSMIQYFFNARRNITTNKMDYPSMLAADIADRAMTNARRNTHGTTTVPTFDWINMGPTNIGGRTRAILIDNNDPTHQTIFAGGVSGGIWKSTDGGGHWGNATSTISSSLNDTLSNINVSCIAQDANGAIYIGTGEGFTVYEQGDGFSTGILGGGIFKSTNDGATWRLLTKTVPVANTDNVTWAYVNRIAIRPDNFKVIYAATQGGLMVSHDSGAHWNSAYKTPTSKLSGSFTALDVKISTDGSVVMACIGGSSSIGFDPSTTGCYGYYCYPQSAPDSIFTEIKSSGVGHLNGNGCRIEFAISPTDANRIYASVINNSGKFGVGGTGSGIFMTMTAKTNGGYWYEIGPGGSGAFDPYISAFDQCNYDNTLGVPPANEAQVLVGGTVLYEWSGTNSSDTVGYWEKVSHYNPAISDDPLWIHADEHAIVFDNTNTSTVYIGCDGGIFKCTNMSIDPSDPIHSIAGLSIQPINRNYNVTQYYTVCYSPEVNYENVDYNNGTMIEGMGCGGGTQDNGTPYMNGTAISHFPNDATDISGGDGAGCAVSQLNPNIAYFCSDNGAFQKEANLGTLSPPTNAYNQTTGDCKGGDIDSMYSVAGASNGVCFVFPVALYENPYDLLNHDSVTYITSKAYNAGDTIWPSSANSAITYPYILTSHVSAGDTLTVPDRVVSRVAIGFGGGASAGIWINGQGASNNTVVWMPIGGPLSKPTAFSDPTPVQAIAWTADGNTIFAGCEDGGFYRFTGVNTVIANKYCSGALWYNEGTIHATGNTNIPCKALSSGLSSLSGRDILSIATDPKDTNKVIVTAGNYNQTVYVYYTDSALSANPTFISVQGNLPAMPVYGSILDILDSNGNSIPNSAMLATEHGIYTTKNITASPVVWTKNSGGLANVMTGAIKQQTFKPWQCNNSGVIYAGSDGRGIWSTNNEYRPTAVQDITASAAALNNLLVYPNPMTSQGNIQFNLAAADNITITIYDMQGNQVKTITMGNQTPGNHQVTFASSGLREGTYFASLTGDNFRKVSKFVVVK